MSDWMLFVTLWGLFVSAWMACYWLGRVLDRAIRQ